MIRYKASRTFKEIVPTTVFSETEHRVEVCVNGRRCREAKETSYHRYCDTYQDARNYLIAGAEAKLQAAKGMVSYVENELAKLKQIPEVEPSN